MTVTPADCRQLEAIVANRSAPQKHVWRANIILATADPTRVLAAVKRGKQTLESDH